MQLKQSFFFESISLRFLHFFFFRLSLTSFMTLFFTVNTCTGALLLLFFFEKDLSFYVFDHYLICFSGFLSVYLLNGSNSFAKFYSCQLSSRSALIRGNLPKVNLTWPINSFSLPWSRGPAH